MNSDDKDRFIKLLRDQVALLISRNLALQRQIEKLEQEKAEMAVEGVATAITRSIRSAELAMADETPEGRRYIISHLQTTLRGFIAQRDNAVVLSLPRPELTVPPDQLGSIQMTVTQVPPLPIPDAILTLTEVLESAQAAFSKWESGLGSGVARDIVTHLTHILAIRQNWGGNEFVQAMQDLAKAAVKFANAVTRRVSREHLQTYRISAANLFDLMQPLVQARRATIEEISRLNAALQQLVRDYQIILLRMKSD